MLQFRFRSVHHFDYFAQLAQRTITNTKYTPRCFTLTSNRPRFSTSDILRRTLQWFSQYIYKQKKNSAFFSFWTKEHYDLSKRF